MVVSNGGRGQVGSQSVHKDVRGGDRAYNDLEFTQSIVPQIHNQGVYKDFICNHSF